MLDLDIAPVLSEVFSNEATVAVVRLFLAAKQAAALQNFARRGLDAPRPHQLKKLPLVRLPVAVLRLLVEVENLGRWGEFGEMHVIDVADGLGEIAQVILLCEARKL